MGQLGSTTLQLAEHAMRKLRIRRVPRRRQLRAIWPIKYELAAFPSHFQPHTHTYADDKWQITVAC